MPAFDVLRAMVARRLVPPAARWFVEAGPPHEEAPTWPSISACGHGPVVDEHPIGHIGGT